MDFGTEAFHSHFVILLKANKFELQFTQSLLKRIGLSKCPNRQKLPSLAQENCCAVIFSCSHSTSAGEYCWKQMVLAQVMFSDHQLLSSSAHTAMVIPNSIFPETVAQWLALTQYSCSHQITNAPAREGNAFSTHP